MLGRRVARRGEFNCSVIVSWGELTSSKLKAQSYKEAGKRVPTTDYRLPTTMPTAVASLCVSGGNRVPTTDHRAPTTLPTAVASLCASGGNRAPTTDHRLPITNS